MAESWVIADASVAVAACSQPAGTVVDATDCDDADAGAHSGATEICDGADQDCDGAVDEGAVDMGIWYADADGDGYGDPGVATTACAQPSGTVDEGSDCDDGDAGVHPGATEHCDGVDTDCDGDLDGGAVEAGTWYADADGDGYGDPTAGTTACSQPAGTVSDASDCDDGDASIHPGVAEYCDGVDTDCDGSLDPVSTVTFTTAAGVRTDVSSSFTPSSSGSSSAWAFSSSGTLAFCAGTYQGRIQVTAADATLVGMDGAALTTLSPGSVATIITVTGAAANLWIGGLTLSGGTGSDGGCLSSKVSGLTLVAEDLVVTSGTANDGGGIYIDHADSVTLTDVEVRGCAASSYGGGLYLKHLAAEATGLVVAGNAASSRGGGVYLEDATLDLVDGVIDGNTCTATGGGMHVKGHASVDLVDTLVDGNLAANGGGLYLDDSFATCTGTTGSTDYEGFVRNTASTLGGALYVKGSGATWSASTCDLGTGSDDNAVYDVYVETGGAGYSWGDDATFSCDRSSCW